MPSAVLRRPWRKADPQASVPAKAPAFAPSTEPFLLAAGLAAPSLT